MDAQLGQEGADAGLDLVADGADRVDALAGGVVELPVLGRFRARPHGSSGSPAANDAAYERLAAWVNALVPRLANAS